ncbi:unnamed protein product [Polarella glacialis]|uniref:EF-hand domain-containing protein n=2 Tax=Polarella glacialis TaxID=89957 RepID=A0A813D5S2_POLGL|nr:unnamed protein product [Polarella glacialis]
MPMFSRQSFLSPSAANSIGKLQFQVTKGADTSYRDMLQTFMDEADKCMSRTGGAGDPSSAERCRTAPHVPGKGSSSRPPLLSRVASPMRRRTQRRVPPCSVNFEKATVHDAGRCATPPCMAPGSALPPKRPSTSSLRPESRTSTAEPLSRPATSGWSGERDSSRDSSLVNRCMAAQSSSKQLPERVGTPTGGSALMRGAGASFFAETRKQTPDYAEQAASACDRKLTRHTNKEAARLFLPHASLEGALSKEQFAMILLQVVGCDSKEELPQGMLEQAFCESTTAGSGGKMTFGDFVSWFSRAGFDQEVLLTSEQREFRKLCREKGMNILDVERYRQYFNEFDIDRSGTVEKHEFEALVRKCAKVRANVEIPSSRFQQLWKDCDQDGSGEVTFEEFLMFYRRYFDDSSGDKAGFEGYYQSVRPALGQK